MTSKSMLLLLLCSLAMPQVHAQFVTPRQPLGARQAPEIQMDFFIKWNQESQKFNFDFGPSVATRSVESNQRSPQIARSVGGISLPFENEETANLYDHSLKTPLKSQVSLQEIQFIFDHLSQQKGMTCWA